MHGQLLLRHQLSNCFPHHCSTPIIHLPPLQQHHRLSQHPPHIPRFPLHGPLISPQQLQTPQPHPWHWLCFSLRLRFRLYLYLPLSRHRKILPLPQQQHNPRSYCLRQRRSYWIILHLGRHSSLPRKHKRETLSLPLPYSPHRPYRHHGHIKRIRPQLHHIPLHYHKHITSCQRQQRRYRSALCFCEWYLREAVVWALPASFA